MRRLIILLTLLALGALTACGSTGSGETGGAEPVGDPRLAQRAQQFVDTYVTEDGRVLRLDQGRDVVSEGQAYGLLIAELAGDDEAVRSIWSWTAENLRRDQDGLLSFHADWAMGPPAVVNPSYWMPVIARGMAHLTGDERWSEMADAMVTLLAGATGEGRSLPSDWARLVKSRLRLTEHPAGGEPPRYGPDAQRTPIFFAAGCSERATGLAAAWWKRLSDERLAVATRLEPTGAVADGNPSPLAMLATAATARAAGEDGRAEELTGRALDQAARVPTYYGDAWTVLGPAIGQGELSGC